MSVGYLQVNLLQQLMNPASIAIAGASDNPNTEAYRLARNLLQGGYAGKLFLVNAKHKRILKHKVYNSLRKLPEPVELAIILTPEDTLERMIRNCAEAGIRLALIMTLSNRGRALANLAHSVGVRILGPTSAGLISPAVCLNATYSESPVTQGQVAVVSQSAALISAVMDWASNNTVGFSALVSTGFEADIGVADIVDYLADDYHTRAIILYLDRVRHPRAFLSAISAAARNKPVLLMKSTQDSARFCDALTRTGEVYTSDRVFQAALERAGAVRIKTFSNLFSAAKTLSSGMRTRGRRIAIVSNGAAPAMLACDRIQTKDFILSPLPIDTQESLDTLLGDNWSRVNPVVLRNYESMLETFAAVLNHLLQSDQYDAVLVLYAPDPRCDPLELAQSIEPIAKASHKPVLACWMGEAQIIASREYFNRNGVLNFRTPEAATDAFDFLYRYYRSQQLLLQSPEPVQDESEADFQLARQIVRGAYEQGMRLLDHRSSTDLLDALAVPRVKSLRVTSAQHACQQAREFGFPVMLKLFSAQLRYHPQVQGIEHNLLDDSQLIRAYEKIHSNLQQAVPGVQQQSDQPEMVVEPTQHAAHSRVLAVRVFNDPTFSRTLSIGFGGDMQSMLYQRPVQLPPLNQYLIDDILDNNHLKKYLGIYRQRPAASRELLSKLLHTISATVCEVPDIYELEFNSIVLNHQSISVGDVQITVHSSLPQSSGYAHLSIHPYPRNLSKEVELNNGKRILIRPIKAEDGEGIASLINNMSAESRYMRFMHAMEKLPPKMIAQFSKIDYDRQMAFCATPVDQPDHIIGVSRYTINLDKTSSEFAIETADEWHGQGLSKLLMSTLIERAREQGLSVLEGDVLRNNHSMRGLMESMGFECKVSAESPEQLICRLNLQVPTA